MREHNLLAESWPDYELLDSGNNKKLERFGPYTLIRPETQAIWNASHPELWNTAHGEFRFNGGKGSWRARGIPESWEIAWRNDARITLRLTAFKHIGIFPEQAPNWEWIGASVDALRAVHGVSQPKILNLFGYTGIASIVAARHGALVTHLDASKQSNTWARENALRSNVPADTLRYITDDALAFVKRELRRGTVYDGIILDPPAFGRGPDGEVWRIEEDICPLLEAIKHLYSKKPGAFLLLNGYAAGYAPRSFAQAVEGTFPELNASNPPSRGVAQGDFGELRIQEKNSHRVVPSGIYVRFVR